MNARDSLVLAAMSGVLLGVTACGGSAPEPSTEATPTTTRTVPQDKHACKGQNDCAHQGGCKTDTHSCKGLNDCRAQGGCKG